MANGSGPGGSDRLKTNEAGKKAAAKALRNDIRPDVRTAGTTAEEGTAQAGTALHGWSTAKALKNVHDEWDRQVRNLQALLSADEEALTKTAEGFSAFDRRTGKGFDDQRTNELLRRFYGGTKAKGD
ncbi:hypothetical protein ACSNOK_04910 [Streptomyces sp. URMC 126]|uniref:hypothetical protein n=1 Tax=Streptomyces sp. URMC 126 TaxID=3423401 RepID=UPI003F19B4F5